MKHHLFNDLRTLEPKYPLIRYTYWEQHDGQILGVCPLTALALDQRLITTEDLLECKVSGHDICTAVERSYGLANVSFVFTTWDSMHDDATRTLDNLADVLEERS